ncbi:hypothetical protein [Aeromicrobium sp.]|uniref:hypothetical protein n=1 Tax=Aeromicrobium sp. TaxID=1871063 RepID=UPI003C6353E7
MKLSAQTAMLSVAASVLLLTAACGGSSDPAGDVPSASSASAAPESSSSSNAVYNDGDYSGEGSYSNPAGISALTVELTLSDGTITAIDVTPRATDPTSKAYQTDFAGGIAQIAVGKSINELSVSKVAGSSLTAEGFNQAIDQIRAEAQA